MIRKKIWFAFYTPPSGGNHYIYALLGENGAIKYVGRTQAHPCWRSLGHYAQRSTRDTPMTRWLKELGHPPTYMTLEICKKKNAPERERFWVQKMHQEGHDLFNKYLIPGPQTVIAIYNETGGKVGPKDLFAAALEKQG